jgi:hypothetical protein
MEAVDFLNRSISENGAMGGMLIYFAYLHYKDRIKQLEMNNKLIKLMDNLGIYLTNQDEKSNTVSVLQDRVNNQDTRLNRVEVLINEQK